MTVRILLVDDHKMIRDGLRALIEKQRTMEVLGEAADGQTAVQSVRKLSPDVVVIDIGMPELNGIEATRQILQAVPGIKVLILSAHNDDAYVDRAMESGAMGYLIKLTSASILVEAIREVQRGNIFLCPEVAKLLHTRKKELLDRKGESQEEGDRP